MKANYDIDSVITFLQQKKKGYTSVEVVDDVRTMGWFDSDFKISFIKNEAEPKVLGIDARSKR